MNEKGKDLLLDCLSSLWAISKRSDDYWRHVASMEWEECLSYFSSILKYPTQVENLFGSLSHEEKDKILIILDSITHKNRSRPLSFLEICTWAAIVDARSASLRKEWFSCVYTLDRMSRNLVGAPSELSEEQLYAYLNLCKRYNSLCKHLHPAFDFSRDITVSAPKREAA